MALGLLLPLRITQAVFAAILLALAAYVHHCITEGHTKATYTSENNFLIFVPIFALLCVAYLEIAPRLKPEASHPHSHLVIEFLNTIFFFSGFIALAKAVSQASNCSGSICAAAKAEVVFAAFGWVLWSGTTLLALIGIFKRGCCGSRARKQQDIAMKEAEINAV